MPIMIFFNILNGVILHRLGKEMAGRSKQLSLRITNTSRVGDHVTDVHERLQDLVNLSSHVSNQSAIAMVHNKGNKEQLYKAKVRKDGFIRNITSFL